MDSLPKPPISLPASVSRDALWSAWCAADLPSATRFVDACERARAAAAAVELSSSVLRDVQKERMRPVLDALHDSCLARGVEGKRVECKAAYALQLHYALTAADLAPFLHIANIPAWSLKRFDRLEQSDTVVDSAGMDAARGLSASVYDSRADTGSGTTAPGVSGVPEATGSGGGGVVGTLRFSAWWEQTHEQQDVDDGSKVYKIHRYLSLSLGPPSHQWHTPSVSLGLTHER